MLALDNLRRAIGIMFGKEDPRQPPPSRAVPVWSQGAPLPAQGDVRLLLDQAYRRNVVAYVAVQERATALASLPLKARVVGGADLPPAHPLSRILRRPNPEQSRHDLIEGAWTNLLGTGSCFVHKARNAGGLPVQLWNLRSDRTKIVPGAYGIASYLYEVPGVKEQTIPAEDVVRIALYDPLEDFAGLSPLAVAARAIDLDNKALDYLRAFFLNGAAPAGILRFKEPVEDAERERMRLKWKQLYGSARGWHELAVIDGDAEYQEIGSRPEKLHLESIWTPTETRICAALGVPPILVQVATGLAKATFSNYREALKAFWSETVLTDVERLSAALTNSLGGDFSGEVEVYADLAGVDVLRDGAAEKVTVAVAAFAGDLVSLDEARGMAGLPPWPDAEAGEKRKSEIGAETAAMIAGGDPAAGFPPAKDEEDEGEDEKDEAKDEEDDPKEKAAADLTIEVPGDRVAEVVKALLERAS